jgi:hypothetical protein
VHRLRQEFWESAGICSAVTKESHPAIIETGDYGFRSKATCMNKLSITSTQIRLLLSFVGLRLATVKPGQENSADTGVILKVIVSDPSAAGYTVPLTSAANEYVSVLGSLSQLTISVINRVKGNGVAVRMSVIDIRELGDCNRKVYVPGCGS